MGKIFSSGGILQNNRVVYLSQDNISSHIYFKKLCPYPSRKHDFNVDVTLQNKQLALSFLALSVAV